jgi:hypothetical protein
LVSFALSPLISPLQATHGNNTDKHDRRDSDSQQGHPPRDNQRNKHTKEKTKECLSENRDSLRRHAIQGRDVFREHICKDARCAVFSIEPTNLFEKDSPYQITAHVEGKVFASGRKHRLFDSGGEANNKTEAKEEPEIQATLFSPVGLVIGAYKNHLNSRDDVAKGGEGESIDGSSDQHKESEDFGLVVGENAAPPITLSTLSAFIHFFDWVDLFILLLLFIVFERWLGLKRHLSFKLFVRLLVFVILVLFILFVLVGIVSLL